MRPTAFWSWLQALFFILAGIAHLLVPGPYLSMMTPALPYPGVLVAVSGLAEIAGGVGLLIGATRRAAAAGLIVLLVAVFPANLHVALHGWPGTAIPAWVLWLRLPLQPVFIGWVYALALRRPPAQRTDRTPPP